MVNDELDGNAGEVMTPALDADVLLLGVLYGLLVFGLLLMAMASAWHWRWKLLMVLCSGVAMLSSHDIWQNTTGWPTAEALPPEFVFHTAVFSEPQPELNDAGAIFVWAQPLLNKQMVHMPRVYRLPYQEDLRDILQEGVKKTREGSTLLGRMGKNLGPQGTTWMPPGQDDEMQIELRNKPQAVLPEK